MGGCIPQGPSAKLNTNRTTCNPIQRIINQYSIEKLRTKWNAQQLKTVSHKIDAFENSTFSEQEFCQLFPKLKNFQASTKNKIYELFAYLGKERQLSKIELINALTLVRKVQTKKDFAPLLFYIYTNDPSHKKMTLQEFRFFEQENTSYVTQIEELQELLSELEEAKSIEKIDVSRQEYHQIVSPDMRKKIKGQQQSNLSPIKSPHQTAKKESASENSSLINIKKKLSIQKVGKGEVSMIDLKLFIEILQKYNLEAYQLLFSWDQDEEEKQLVEKISASGIVRKRGEKVFIISYHWWLAWKSYVEIKYEKMIKVDQQNHNYASTKIQAKRNSSVKMIEVIKYNQKEKPQRPGEIKNHCLLKRSKTRGIELTENLVEFDNYICIPEELWSKLVAIYHGGPPIQRIYPQIYYNLVLKVVLDAQGHFQHKALKKFTNKDKKTVMEYAVASQVECMPYYKYPGRNNWLRYQPASNHEDPFNCPRTYLVFVPPKLIKQFTNIYNIQEIKNGKCLKERLLNYGSQINFSVDGVLTKAEVIEILTKDEIKVSYNDDYAVSKLTTVRIDESLRILNPNNLEKEKLLNDFSGLANIGNTCYMNAVLQCLIRTPSFGSYLQQENFKQKKKDEEILLQEMLKIYSDSKTNSQEVINTHNFKRVFDKYCPFFEGNLQHDAQEFLICLLERLSEEIKSKKQQYGTGEAHNSNQKNDAMQKSVNKKVVQFFSGKTEAITECLSCKNKNKRVQPFFTYSLSLPEPQEAQFFYYFIEDFIKLKSTVPIRYGITLDRKVTIENFLVKIAKVHKKDIENIALYTVFNNQILNKLQPKSWQNEISHHLNFDVKLVCFEFKHAATPTYIHYKERRLQNKSVKIELRQRFYSQKTNQYKITYLPMFLEVTALMKWDDLIKNINQIVAKFYPEQTTPQPTTTSGIRIAEADIQLSLQASSSGIKNTKKSSSDLKKNGSAANTAKYKIRVIKTDHYYQNYCMFCKEEFVLSRKSRGIKACKGDKCTFNPEVALFEDPEFRNYNDLVILTVDWQQFPQFPIFQNHPSYEQALSRSENRKNFLEDLLIKNFENKEKLELKCERKQCGYQYVERIERIEVPPNILLLHLKRFNYEDNRLIKLTNHVIYPSKFTLPGTLEQYQLYGVVVHIGSGVGGHYISYVQVKGRWYKCDDSKVSLAGPGTHIDHNAYLLFYKKIDFEPSLICLSI